MKEEWRDIPEYKDKYQVSSYGRVRSVARKSAIGYNVSGRPVKDKTGKHGFRKVMLRDDDRHPIYYYVHELVASAFLGVPLGSDTKIRHKDGIVYNNLLENLEINDTEGMAGR